MNISREDFFAGVLEAREQIETERKKKAKDNIDKSKRLNNQLNDYAFGGKNDCKPPKRNKGRRSG